MEPFQVMCVSADWRPSIEVEYEPHPKVGDTCIVVDKGEYFGIPYYILEGYGSAHGFAQYNFATLPGLSADEINELEKEAIIK